MSIKFTKIKKCIDLTDTMPFGKYQGLTLARVIVDDVRYISWLMNVSTQFFLSDKAHEVFQNAYRTYLLKKPVYYGKRYSSNPQVDYCDDYETDSFFDQEFIYT